MGSRLFEEIREKRGLCYSVSAAPHALADASILQLSSGLDSAKCIEAYRRMREIVDELREQGPTDEEVERSRAYAAGRTVLAFENSSAVASTVARHWVVFDEPVMPEMLLADLDAVSVDAVRAVAAGISEQLAVACVGPHSAEEF